MIEFEHGDTVRFTYVDDGRLTGPWAVDSGPYPGAHGKIFYLLMNERGLFIAGDHHRLELSPKFVVGQKIMVEGDPHEVVSGPYKDGSHLSWLTKDENGDHGLCWEQDMVALVEE